MTYDMTKELADTPFEAAVERVTGALKTEGFGVLTEIDIKSTFKKKLDVDMPKYTILGACNPNLAHQAINADPNIGLLLPCNVVVRATEKGSVVSIIDPRQMFSVVDNPHMEPIVSSVEAKLQNVLNAL